MAEGAWVPAFDSLWGSRKTRRMARDVRRFSPTVDYAEVAAAKFLKLIRWMRENAPSGDLGPVDRAAIALAVDIVRPTDKHELQVSRGEAFYRALVDAEFVSDDPRGHVRGWSDGPGRLVHRREEDRLRKEHERSGHGQANPACPRCRRVSDGQPAERAANTARSATTARDRPSDVHRTRGDRPTEVRPDSTQQRQQREQRTPQPPARKRGQDEGSVGTTARSPGEVLARQVLDGAGDPRWRDALQALLIGGMTAANLATWFADSSLEERDGWAIVRVPNDFARERLETKYRPDVARALGLESSRVVFARRGHDVVLEPEPVEEGEALHPPPSISTERGA